jgi:hypothetical protein
VCQCTHDIISKVIDESDKKEFPKSSGDISSSASGSWYVNIASYFLQRRCRNAGHNTRWWDECEQESFANSYVERLCILQYVPVQAPCLVPNTSPFFIF